MTQPVIELADLHVKIGKREILRGLNLELRGLTSAFWAPTGRGRVL